MNRLATLQKRSTELTRKLFAGQSYYVRLARVFEIVTGSDPLLQALGRGLGAVFLLKGVTNLPDVNGKPALEWLVEQPRQDINTLVRKLPSTYLDHEVTRLRNGVYSKFGDSMGNEIISNWLMRFISMNGYKNMHEGISLSQAMGYAFTGLKNDALNTIKRNRHENKQQSLDEMNDEGNRARIDPADPKSVKDFLEESPMWKAPKVRHILETKAHPDAPLYLDLLMQGYTNNEIVGDPRKDMESMLPHVKTKPITPQGWLFVTMPKIKEILEKVSQQEI